MPRRGCILLPSNLSLFLSYFLRAYLALVSGLWSLVSGLWSLPAKGLRYLPEPIFLPVPPTGETGENVAMQHLTPNMQHLTPNT